jgi:hypothetical protein
VGKSESKNNFNKCMGFFLPISSKERGEAKGAIYQSINPLLNTEESKDLL